MQIVMTTCAREPAYVDDTLDALFASDATIEKVHVLVHEREVECIARWLNHPKISWRKLSQEEHNAKMLLGRRVKVAHATRLALAIDSCECILLQDDAIFAPNWLHTFEQQLKDFGPTRAWSMIALSSHLRSTEKGIIPWRPQTYWGLVAMYFGSVARKNAVASLAAWERQEQPAPGMGADVCLKHMLEASSDVKLFARYPSLVQHAGVVSSIGSGARRREAPSFNSKKAPVTFPPSKKPGWPTNMVDPVTVHSKKTSKPRKNPNPPVQFPHRVKQK
jgi:hypothetical protein